MISNDWEVFNRRRIEWSSPSTKQAIKYWKWKLRKIEVEEYGLE